MGERNQENKGGGEAAGRLLLRISAQWAKSSQREGEGWSGQSQRNGRKKPRKTRGWGGGGEPGAVSSQWAKEIKENKGGGQRSDQSSFGTMGERNQGDCGWVIVLIPGGGHHAPCAPPFGTTSKVEGEALLFCVSEAKGTMGESKGKSKQGGGGAP